MLSPRKVRLAPDSHSLYFVTYERERKETTFTLFKSDGTSEWRVVVKALVDADPDDLHPTGSKDLLVVVDEVAERVTIAYQPTPALAGVGEQGFVLRHIDLRQTGGGGAATLLGAAYKACGVPVPGSMPASERRAALELGELLFHEDELLLSAVFQLSTGDVHLALFLLETLEPARLKVQLVSSLPGESVSAQKYFRYKDKFICAPGRLPASFGVFACLCSVMEPVVLPLKNIEECTIFADASGGSSGQAVVQCLLGITKPQAFVLLGERRGWLLFDEMNRDASRNVYAIRGWHVANAHVFVVRKMDLHKSALKWANERLPVHEAAHLMPVLSLFLHGGSLMVRARIKDVSPNGVDDMYLTRINLDSWLNKAPLCSNCHITKPPNAPDKIQACVICQARSFDSYPWLFGSRFCGAECLQQAWPTHRKLHEMPPLDDWRLWRRLFKPDLDSL